MKLYAAYSRQHTNMYTYIYIWMGTTHDFMNLYFIPQFLLGMSPESDSLAIYMRPLTQRRHWKCNGIKMLQVAICEFFHPAHCTFCSEWERPDRMDHVKECHSNWEMLLNRALMVSVRSHTESNVDFVCLCHQRHLIVANYLIVANCLPPYELRLLVPAGGWFASIETSENGIPLACQAKCLCFWTILWPFVRASVWEHRRKVVALYIYINIYRNECGKCD